MDELPKHGTERVGSGRPEGLPLAAIQGAIPRRETREMIGRPPGPILAATLAALRHTNEGAALLLRPGPSPDPERLRLAQALLRDAIARGGTLLEAGRGEMLLLSEDTKGVAGLQPVLARLFADQPESLRFWRLPHEATDLLTWSESAQPAARAVPSAAADPIAVMERLAARPVEHFLRREVLLQPDAALRPAGLRLALDERAIAAEAEGDAHLAEHARALLAGRCAEGLANPTKLRQWLGGAVKPPLLIDLPIDAFSAGIAAQPPLPPGELPPVLGVLPAAMLADGEGLARLRRGLAARGWGLALGGIDAALLPFLQPARIRADMLIVAWSPALLEMEAGLREAGPQRLMLQGCDEPVAIGFAARLGIPRLSGPLPERLAAMARMAGCPHRDICGADACQARARATEAAGREGCLAPHLLAGNRGGSA